MSGGIERCRLRAARAKRGGEEWMERERGLKGDGGVVGEPERRNRVGGGGAYHGQGSN